MKMNKMFAVLAIVALTGCASMNKYAQAYARGVQAEGGSGFGSESGASGTKTELRFLESVSEGRVYVVDSGYSFGASQNKKVLILTEAACAFYSGTAWVSYSEFGSDNYLSHGSGGKCRILAVKRAE